MEENEIHVLSEFEFQPVQASQGKRLANYIIDVVAFYAFLFIFSFVLGSISMDSANTFIQLLDAPFGTLIVLLMYALLLGIIEALSKGRTLGKVITATKAVNEDGSAISAQTAFLRGFCRAVPFCAFSALGNPCYPWQDKWTKTYVIDMKQSYMNQ